MIDTKKLGNGKAAPDNVYPVVVPDNMGKGHIWNAQTNKYDIDVREANGVKLNPDGSVGLAVSPDKGNMIELRDNGIYYGLVPKQGTIYVSSTLGNDSNDGSRSSPVKTVHRALNIINEQKTGGVYWIRLRVGESFSLATNPLLGNASYQVYFAGYDDAKYGDALSFGIYATYAMQEYNRPKLTFDTYNENGVVRCATILGSEVGLHFYGIEVHFASSAGASTSGASYFYASVLDFRGSILYFDGVMSAGSADTIRLDTSRIETINANKLFQSDNNPILFVINSAGGGSGITVSANGVSGTSLVSNIKEKITVDNAMGNSAVDKTTKTTFGWTTNWDIFAK